jgi:hypothetical protein
MQCAQNYTVSPNASQCLINCTIPNCRSCNILLLCIECNDEHTLAVNNIFCFIECNILYCSTCHKKNLCSSCYKGYNLLNNSCLLNCPSGSVSVEVGSSVSCLFCFDVSQYCTNCTSLNATTNTCTVCSSVAYLSANGTFNSICKLCNSSLQNCL